jgi:hypothetical protein
MMNEMETTGSQCAAKVATLIGMVYMVLLGCHNRLMEFGCWSNGWTFSIVIDDGSCFANVVVH